jgi:syntaxin-binding protein 5
MQLKHAIRAVDDEDKPLLCMTLDDMDVNLVDGTKMERCKTSPLREPIFKLAWSGFANSADPRGGETALLVLGGTASAEAAGVNVLWLPALRPPEVPMPTQGQSGIHPTVRTAMRESVTPINQYFYTTPAPVQDFLLIPSSSPHYNGAFDPTALLLLFESEGGTRALDGFTFPPPEFTAERPLATSPTVGSPTSAKSHVIAVDLEQELADTLKSMKLHADPAHVWLSPPLWNGKNAPLYPELLKLERDAYSKFTNEPHPTDPLRLNGGIAWLEDAADTKLIKVCDRRRR